jgi:transcriptional regulator with XRE-family HTH domain
MVHLGVVVGRGTEIAIVLRKQLRQRRVDLGLSQQQVADRTAAEWGEVGSLTKQTISSWERFVDQPRIDAFAAWARALELRLHVQLYDPSVERASVRVPPNVVDTCSVLAMLPPEKLAAVHQMAVLLAGEDAAGPTAD